MKELINNWLQSQKYRDLKKQFDEKRKYFLNSLEQVSKFKKENPMPKLTKQQLIEQINTLLIFDKASEYDRFEYEHKTFSIFSTTDKTTLFYDISNQLICWYFHLYEQVQEEEFELCAKIRDVIEIEKREFMQALIKYHPQYEEIIDEDLLKDIDVEIKRIFI